MIISGISPSCHSYTNLQQQTPLTHAMRKSNSFQDGILFPCSKKSSAYMQVPLGRKFVVCKSQMSSQDAPLAMAIGTCLLHTLTFPDKEKKSEEDGDGMEDMRYAAMGIISFIPFFNWLSWVFAWLDTGRKKYLIYAIAYLAPYIRSELSLLPDDSWLPVASILICVLHIQLEISTRNGDLMDIQSFSNKFSPLKYMRGKEEEDDEENVDKQHSVEETEKEELDNKTLSFLEERLAKDKEGFQKMREIYKIHEEQPNKDDRDSP